MNSASVRRFSDRIASGFALPLLISGRASLGRSDDHVDIAAEERRLRRAAAVERNVVELHAAGLLDQRGDDVVGRAGLRARDCAALALLGRVDERP